MLCGTSAVLSARQATPTHCRVSAGLPGESSLVSYCYLPTLRALLSGTFLQTLPDLVTPLNGHSISAQLSTDAVSALRKARVLIRLWKQPSAQDARKREAHLPRVKKRREEFRFDSKRFWFYLSWHKQHGKL